MEHRTDEELFDAWRLGDRSAGNLLVRRHAPAIRRFVRRRVVTEVEDTVQNIWVAVTRSLDTFERRCSVAAFFYAVARNLAREAIRSNCKASRSQEFADDHPADVRDPVDVLDHARHWGIVTKQLPSLPMVQQQAIEAYYFEGKSAPHIAAQTGMREPAVRSRLRRAKCTLRSHLDRESSATL